MSTAAGGGAAAAAAAIANAVKASGVIVRVEPRDFVRILERQETPLVVHSAGGVFTTTHRYLSSYKGLAFFAKSAERLPLPGDCEVVEAKTIWIPG
jgi:hypothetical protein